MTETVWVVTSSDQERFHTDSGCPNLRQGDEVEERAREAVTDSHDHCGYCRGDARAAAMHEIGRRALRGEVTD